MPPTDSRKDAYHTRTGPQPSTSGSGEKPYLQLDKNTWAVGEAYGPPELHAWMEGACASAEAAVRDATRCKT